MNRQRPPTIYPPSVGELMDRANLMARDLLYHAPDRDGRSMVLAWGEVVESAGALWRQLPKRSDVPGTGNEVMDQLERATRILHRSAGHSTLEVDPTLQEIGEVLARAADLVHRRGLTEPRHWTEAELQDAWAARVNVMHTVYLASHAVSVGLGNNAQAERSDARLRVHKVLSGELQRRVWDIEGVAHSYINGHYPLALAGRHREPVDDTRVPGAVSAWDVHMQRALARHPSTHTMVQVAGSAFTASTHAHRLWRTAVEAGVVDRRTFEKEIEPALENMIQRWGEAHDLFQRLTHPRENSGPSVKDAAAELTSAMREVTVGPQGSPLPVEAIGSRVDVPALVRSLHHFHASVADVGGAFAETARAAPLQVDARSANELIKAGLDPDERRHQDKFDVSPRDILWKRSIEMPMSIRGRVAAFGFWAASASRASLRTTFKVVDQGNSAATTGAPRSTGRPADSLERSQAAQTRQLAAVPSDPDRALPR